MAFVDRTAIVELIRNFPVFDDQVDTWHHIAIFCAALQIALAACAKFWIMGGDNALQCRRGKSDYQLFLVFTCF